MKKAIILVLSLFMISNVVLCQEANKLASKANSSGKTINRNTETTKITTPFYSNETDSIEFKKSNENSPSQFDGKLNEKVN